MDTEETRVKRPRLAEGRDRGLEIEERKALALEAIAVGLDRMTSVMDRLEEETRTCGDLAALCAFKEADFPIGEWDQQERFADYVISESKKWVEDKLRGKDVEGNL